MRKDQVSFTQKTFPKLLKSLDKSANIGYNIVKIKEIRKEKTLWQYREK